MILSSKKNLRSKERDRGLRIYSEMISSGSYSYGKGCLVDYLRGMTVNLHTM